MQRYQLKSFSRIWIYTSSIFMFIGLIMCTVRLAFVMIVMVDKANVLYVVTLGIIVVALFVVWYLFLIILKRIYWGFEIHPDCFYLLGLTKKRRIEYSDITLLSKSNSIFNRIMGLTQPHVKLSNGEKILLFIDYPGMKELIQSIYDNISEEKCKLTPEELKGI